MMKAKRIWALVLALLVAVGSCAALAEGEVLDFLPEARPEPQDDLYGSVNFDALQGVEIPAGYSCWDRFTENELRISEELSEIVDECVAHAGSYEKGSPEQKIADLYLSYVDEESRNATGIEPLRPYLDSIEEAQSVQQYLEAIAALDGELGYCSLLNFEVDADLYDSTRNIACLMQADLGLSNAYLKDESMSRYWELYRTLAKRLLTLYGVPEAEAAGRAEAVFALQRELAASTLADADLYDFSKAYLPMRTEEVAALLPGIDLESVLEKTRLSGVEQMLVVDPGELEAIGRALTEENLPTLKDLSIVTLLKDAAPYLSMDYRQAEEEYSAAKNGFTPKPLREAAKDSVQQNLDWEFGRIYVEKYFPEESKREVLEMVDEIRNWFSERIDALDWMSDETKAAARRKLSAVNVKIGYPDSYDFVAYRDDMEIRSPADGGSLIENRLNRNRVRTAFQRSCVGEAVDRSTWMMTPQTVNAYYSPSSNEIVFPAGILRGAFFDPEASRAANLGGIGAVISHELTHAFDSDGANFDQDGNLNMWWTEEDFAAFKALQQEIVEYYEGFEVMDGNHVDGKLTLGENIADLGGVHCITELCGDDPAALRELFEAYARIWGLKISREEFENRIRTDMHSPNLARANAVARATEAFYEAYDVQEGDGMYLAPEERVGIW